MIDLYDLQESLRKRQMNLQGVSFLYIFSCTVSIAIRMRFFGHLRQLYSSIVEKGNPRNIQTLKILNK